MMSGEVKQPRLLSTSLLALPLQNRFAGRAWSSPNSPAESPRDSSASSENSDSASSSSNSHNTNALSKSTNHLDDTATTVRQGLSERSGKKPVHFLSPKVSPRKTKGMQDFSIKSHTQQGNDELHSSENQDRHVFQYDEARGLLWMGVFDGHSGSAASQFLCTNLIPCITALLPEKFPHQVPELKEAIRKGILETEDRFRELKEPDGACVLLGCLTGLDVIIANVGDSRAVIGSTRHGTSASPEARLLTNDHNASNQAEAKLARYRFLKNNGLLPEDSHPDQYTEEVLIEKVKEVMEGSDIIVNGRLLTVELTRSIGDFGIKKYCFNVVSSEPEFTVITLHEDDRVLIFASDGVWATVTAEDAVSLILDRLRNLSSFYEIGPAEALIQEAVRRGSGDDQTAIILDLKIYKRCMKWNATRKGMPNIGNDELESPLAAAIRKGMFMPERGNGLTTLLYSSAGRAFNAKMARLHASRSFIGSSDPGKFEVQAMEAQPLASSAHRARNKHQGAAAPAPVLGLFEQQAMSETKAREDDKKKGEFKNRSYIG